MSRKLSVVLVRPANEGEPREVHNPAFEPESLCIELQEVTHDNVRRFSVVTSAPFPDDLASKLSKLAESSPTQESIDSKRNILKNLFILSSGFLVLFTAFMSLSNLESSLNPDHGLGTTSLSVIYGALVFSSFGLPAILIQRLGLKLTMVISIVFYLPYFLANFYPSWWTFVPASVVMGLAAAPFWTSKCSYVTELSHRYAKLTNENPSDVLVRFLGIFYMAFQTSQVWGNLIAYEVLKGIPLNASVIFETYPCGVDFVVLPQMEEGSRSEETEKHKIYLLCGIYSVCCIAAAIMLCFLDDIRQPSTQKSPSLSQTMVQTIQQLMDPRQMALVPLSIFCGMIEAFIFGEFTAAYVTCGWGVEYVGFVMIAFGVSNALGSFVSGPATKLLGRLSIMCVGLVATASALALMFLWRPDPSRSDLSYLFFLSAGLWGAGDSVWKTQILGIYGSVFDDNRDVAFSVYRLWEASGFVAAFGYSGFLLLPVKLKVLTSFLVLGFLGYLGVEISLQLKPSGHPEEPECDQKDKVDKNRF